MDVIVDARAFFLDSMNELNKERQKQTKTDITSLDQLLKISPLIEYFKEFLSQQLSQELLLFWIECDLFSKCKIEEKIKELTESIYNKYLKENSLFEIEINKEVIKQIELSTANEEYSFKLFDQAKNIIYEKLKNVFFPQFLKSSLYKEFDIKYMKNEKFWAEFPEIKTAKIVTKERDTSSLNLIYSTHLQDKVKNPLNISQRLMESLIDMLNANYSISSEQIDCELLYQSIPFKRFQVATAELQKLRLITLLKLNDNEANSFWINIYNSLTLHGAISKFIPNDELSLCKFLISNKYKIDDYTFSLFDIKYGILLGLPNYKLKMIPKDFENNDILKKLKIKNVKKKLIFSLITLTSQSSTIRVYYPETLKMELKKTTRVFLSKHIKIDSKNKKLFLPLEIKNYSQYFGSDFEKIIDYITKYLPKKEKQLLLNEKNTFHQRFMKLQYFPILEFDSQYTTL